ncbi:MAG TPA: large conductance mechanosensitive channel protein MscL [Burkholderiales bacterium]|jgi:large conductance mechanosensitive channel
MRTFVSEFREFASRGSVIDLAVAIVIGITLGKIVESVVNDLIAPVLAGLLGKADLSGLFIPLASPPAVPPTLEALRRAGVPVIAYGNFIAVALNVAILALVLFVVVRHINRQRRGRPE